MYRQYSKRNGSVLVAVLFAGFLVALLWVMHMSGFIGSSDERQKNIETPIDDAIGVQELMNTREDAIEDAL